MSSVLIIYLIPLRPYAWSNSISSSTKLQNGSKLPLTWGIHGGPFTTTFTPWKYLSLCWSSTRRWVEVLTCRQPLLEHNYQNQTKKKNSHWIEFQVSNTPDQSWYIYLDHTQANYKQKTQSRPHFLCSHSKYYKYCCNTYYVMLYVPSIFSNWKLLMSPTHSCKTFQLMPSC